MIPITIRNELQAVEWAVKRGYSYTEIDIMLDNWKDEHDIRQNYSNNIDCNTSIKVLQYGSKYNVSKHRRN